MKKFLLALFVVAAAAVLIAPAYATELWDPHLRGTDEGLAAGALPPPGVYFINNSYFAPSYHSYGNLGTVGYTAPSGHSNSNISLFAYVDVPVLLWVPGCKFLGADYAMGIAEPFDYTNLRVKIHQVRDLPLSALNGACTIRSLFPTNCHGNSPVTSSSSTGLSIALNDGTSNPATADTLGPGAFAESSQRLLYL